MGGYGSGRTRGKKVLVEDCLVLSVGTLQRDKLLLEGLHASGVLTWTNTATGEKLSSVGYEVDTIDTAAFVRLHYTMTRTGEAVDYRVRLTTAPLPWGGVRWAFLCPNLSCGRACRKLYLPRGGRHFACRLCHRLTYTSAQEAHKFDGLEDRINRLLAKHAAKRKLA